MPISKEDFSELAKRRLVYIKLANAERVKQNGGYLFNQKLITAYNRVIEKLHKVVEQHKEINSTKTAIK